MYNKIMESLIKKLRFIFPETKIRLGSIEEEEKESFLVAGISQVSENCINGKRYCCSIKIFINYYPKEADEQYEDRYHVLELLMKHLESISLENGVVIGSKDRSGLVENGNLKFQTEYQIFFLKNQEEEVSMEDINLK
ncbi:MAG: hypothetical protein F8N38_22970 [Hungatella sp.]|nr:hypothetical protein [Hungatella sp.]